MSPYIILAAVVAGYIGFKVRECEVNLLKLILKILEDKTTIAIICHTKNWYTTYSEVNIYNL